MYVLTCTSNIFRKQSTTNSSGQILQEKASVGWTAHAQVQPSATNQTYRHIYFHSTCLDVFPFCCIAGWDWRASLKIQQEIAYTFTPFSFPLATTKISLHLGQRVPDSKQQLISKTILSHSSLQNLKYWLSLRSSQSWHTDECAKTTFQEVRVSGPFLQCE